MADSKWKSGDEEIPREVKPVFGVNASFDGVFNMVVGLSDATWEYIKDGKTVNIDLSHQGVPVRLVLFGDRTQVACKRAILAHNRPEGAKQMLDMTQAQDDPFRIKDGGQSLKNLKNSVFK